MHNRQARRLDVDFSTAAGEISLAAAKFGNAPDAFLRHVDAGTSGFSPSLYAAAIRFHSDIGQTGVARRIMLQQKNDERRDAAGFDRVVLTISWLVIGYDLIVERGFIWVGLFVLIGYAVFKTGSKQLRGDTRPD